MRLHPLTLFSAAVGLALLLAPPAAAKARKPHLVARADVVRVVQNPNAVYYGNEYLGADPDPRIRHELLRDLNAHFGGNF